MAFKDVRLPVDVERGASGGPAFSTTVLALSSGHERRNRNWSKTRGRWNIGYGLTRKSDLSAVIDHFYAMGGRADSFRFKDWSDFEIGDDSEDTFQQIGLGDDSTTDFQIFKRYAVGSVFFDREVTKPVETTLRVFLDDVEQTETTHYTVDYSTGIVTFVTPPASSGGDGPSGEEVVSIISDFDVPVRFDTDELNISTEVYSDEAQISVPSIELVEVRAEEES